MKKMMRMGLLFVLLLIVGTNMQEGNVLPYEAYAEAAQSETAVTILPLPDATMENLTDAILSVSFQEGDVYLDDTGKLQMAVKIYTYDQYDLVDISLLQAGDILVTHTGEVEVVSVESMIGGIIVNNGGSEAGGLTLIPDECGVYYAADVNGNKSWYQIGEATIRVSVDFQGYDQADPEQSKIIFYPGSFLVNEVTNYNFTPYNTTIRIEAGQVVELHRTYIP